MSKLIIAEKPSVARDIAKVLKVNKKGDGYLYNEDYVISWAVGHLVTLLDPEDYDQSLKKWSQGTLPIIPEEIKLKPVEQTKKQYDIIEKLIKSDKIDELICATDSGREGELIFRYIYDLAKCNKPFKRLWISSMTDVAIKDGFASLKDGKEYDNLYESAKCRSEADWLVGINATRAYTLQYGTLLSIGRVQTPTLAIIVNRQKEIDEFIVEEYYEVKAKYDNFTGKWINDKQESKIEKKEQADEIVKKCKGHDGIVNSITHEKKNVPAPLLFDLTELQRECNKKFGFSAKKTLSIVQDLYEKKKYVTYPRTDSRYLSTDMISKLKPIVDKLNIEPYEEYSNYVSGLGKLPISKRIIDDKKITDHHAIIPTLTNFNLKSLSKDEGLVFDVIARRFLSVFYPKYEYSATTLIIDINSEKFISKGTTVLKLGWKEVTKDDTKTNKDEEVLPNVVKSDLIKVEDIISEKKKTKPPKPYTEGQLLSAMENAGRFVEDDDLKEHLKESGIGTPATRASIIERLLDVGYIKREKKSLIPTDKGKKLITILPLELTSPETTGKWEKGLTSINKGKMSSEKFMGSIGKYVNYIIKSSRHKNQSVIFPIDEKNNKPISKDKILGNCPNCDSGVILENSKGFFCKNWRSGCKFTIWKNALGKDADRLLDKELIKSLLKDGYVKEISYKSGNESYVKDIIINKSLPTKYQILPSEKNNS